MADLAFIAKPYITTGISDAYRVPEGNTLFCELYYVCVGGKFTMEIIKGAELIKPLYEKKYYRIIGVAGCRAEAFELVRRVTADFVESGSRFDTLGDYLRNYE